MKKKREKKPPYLVSAYSPIEQCKRATQRQTPQTIHQPPLLGRVTVRFLLVLIPNSDWQLRIPQSSHNRQHSRIKYVSIIVYTDEVDVEYPGGFTRPDA